MAKKLPSLYLLDSILKNVGNEYIQVISRVISETFCHVFESVCIKITLNIFIDKILNVRKI